MFMYLLVKCSLIFPIFRTFKFIKLIDLLERCPRMAGE